MSQFTCPAARDFHGAIRFVNEHSAATPQVGSMVDTSPDGVYRYGHAANYIRSFDRF
jgi:hypothetical protein